MSYATAGPRPGPLAVRLLALTSILCKAGFGRLLGHRFLALSHRGRRTGRRYTTALEVVRWRPDAREAVVVSGFGPSVRLVESREAISVPADYERRNRLIAPVVRAVLSRLVGFHYDGSDEDVSEWPRLSR